MKALTKSLLLVMCLVLCSLAVSAQTNQDRFIAINNFTLINQDPDPVGPGEVVEVRFRIENLGEVKAEDMEVELLTEYPFSLRPGESALKPVGTIESKQRGDDAVIVRYKLIVAQGAPDGFHEVRLRYRAGEFRGWITSEPFLVKVQSNNAILSIVKTTTVPAVVAPGDKAKVVIDVKNYASSVLKDIVVELDVDETDLSPMGSSNERVLSALAPGKTGQIEMELIADPNAVAGVVNIPTTLTYRDNIQQNYTKDNTLSIIIGDVPDVTMGIESTEVYTSGSVGDVVIKFVNKGTTDVKFLNLQLGEGEGFEIVGPNEEYIGNLDSDDFSSADFRIHVKDAEGSVELPVIAEYKDANNVNYKLEETVSLKIYSDKEAKQIGVVSGGGSGWIFILIIAVAGFLWYRRKKKKAKKR